MLGLNFASGRLLEGETELARVDADGHVFSAQREYRIVRIKPHGWHYAVEDDSTDRRVCDFEPLRVRRGGRLRFESSCVLMRGRALRPSAWRFTTEAGQQIEATSKFAPADPFRFTMQLRTATTIAAVPYAAITLTFGCWLAVHWQSVPSGPGPGGQVWTGP